MHLLAQLVKFGFVGLLATLVHYLVAVLLIELSVWPLWANFFAFVVAFGVSFFGHFRWTFSRADVCRNTSMLRFFFVAILGFCLNQGLYFVLLRRTEMPPQVSLLFVLGVVAAVTFVLSRQWAFASSLGVAASAQKAKPSGD